MGETKRSKMSRIQRFWNPQIDGPKGENWTVFWNKTERSKRSKMNGPKIATWLLPHEGLQLVKQQINLNQVLHFLVKLKKATKKCLHNTDSVCCASDSISIAAEQVAESKQLDKLE